MLNLIQFQKSVQYNLQNQTFVSATILYFVIAPVLVGCMSGVPKIFKTIYKQNSNSLQSCGNFDGKCLAKIVLFIKYIKFYCVTMARMGPHHPASTNHMAMVATKNTYAAYQDKRFLFIRQGRMLLCSISKEV